MEGLSLINFKSYAKYNIFGFNPYINIIIGGNGQGKSNIFKAFSFVLSDRLQINRSQFSAHLHHGIDVSTQRSIEVQVVMRDKESSQDYVKISKLWKPNLVEQCYINSKLSNKKQYQNFIQSLCLSYTNPYNIVQQGKINQIILMDQFELYKLLQEITGVKKFNRRKEQALSIMKKIQLQKQENKTALMELNEKLKSLENKKQEFEFFAVEEKTKKFRTKKYLTQLLQGTRHNIQKMKAQYDQISQSLKKIILKKKNIQQNIDQGVMSMKIEKEKLTLIDKSTNIDTQMLDTQDLKDIQRKQKQVNKQLKQLAKKMKDKDKAVQSFKKDFAQIQKNYQELKLNKQLNKPKEGKEKAILAFENQIKSQQQNLQQLEKQKQKTIKKMDQIQKIVNNKKSTDIQTKFNKIDEQVKICKSNITQNKRLNLQLAWQGNVVQLQAESLKQYMQHNQLKMKKVLPNLDFTLLDYLRQLKVRGVYGYFIQFVKIDSNVSFAYEIAGMNKLCSLLVEDQQACIAVIQANRKIKGKQINIIQLDYIRGRPADSQSAPKSDNVRKLSNTKWIKPSQYCLNFKDNLPKDIQKLIKNTFQKYALVKDYETGLKISKQYHLNCITGDKQIVYSQGYHCKLGQQSIHYESGLQIFYKFQEKRNLCIQKQKQKQQLDTKILQYQNQQINLINKEQKLQLQMNKISNQFNELKTHRKMLEVYHINFGQLNKNQQDTLLNLNKKKQTLKLITSNSKNKQQAKIPKAQAEKIQSTYHQKRKQLNKMLTQIFQIEDSMQKVSIQKEQIDNKIINAKNSKAAGIINVNSFADDIQKFLANKQQEIKNLEKQAEELNRIQSEIQSNKNHVQVKLITYRAEEQDIEGKLAQVGQIQEDIQQLQELSNSMSVSILHGRKKNRHFSAKDKLLFTKFSNILQNFASHKKTFKDLQDAEQKIKGTISKYQNQSQQYMSQISEKFVKQFTDIFGSIVNQGQADVRFKKVSQKVKDVIRYKNCLTIKVSFSRSGEPMKKWNDFSGGEKTVIALTIVLALQRCEPAPFYVLDEVDAALDSVYVQKIAQLLSKQSQRNKSQYFISSFKEDMLIFSQQICNYYLVTAENRQSQIKKIKQNKAVDALRSLIVKK